MDSLDCVLDVSMIEIDRYSCVTYEQTAEVLVLGAVKRRVVVLHKGIGDFLRRHGEQEG